MSSQSRIAGAVSALCLSVGFAGAETPAAATEAPATVAERSVGPQSAPLPPVPMCRGLMRERPTRQPMSEQPMCAEWMHPGPPAWPADAGTRHVEGMTHVLGLSGEQRMALGKILEQQRSRAAAVRRRLRDGAGKLVEALEAARPAPATVGTLMIEQHTLMQELEAAHDEANQSLRALLTGEQRATFDSLPKPGPGGRTGRGMGPMGRGFCPGRGMGPRGRHQGMAPAPFGPPPAPPGPERRAPGDGRP